MYGDNSNTSHIVALILNDLTSVLYMEFFLKRRWMNFYGSERLPLGHPSATGERTNMTNKI